MEIDFQLLNNIYMGSLLVALNVVLPMFGLMLIGYIAKATGLFDDKTLKQLNRFVFSALISTSLYKSISSSSFKESINIMVLIVTFLGFALSICIGYFLAKKMAKQRNQIPVIWQGVFRGNNVLYGMALVQFLYNTPSIPVVAGLLAITAPLVNIGCVLIFSVFTGDKPDPKKFILSVVKNPLIIACVLAFITMGFKIQLPSFVNTIISQLSSAANPLGLVVLGASFKFEKVADNIKAILSVALVRNFIIPFITVSLAVMCGLKGGALTAIVSMFCVPTALSSFAMAASLGGDSDLAGQIVMVTTLISIFTIFFFIFGLDSLGLL